MKLGIVDVLAASRAKADSYQQKWSLFSLPMSPTKRDGSVYVLRYPARGKVHSFNISFIALRYSLLTRLVFVYQHFKTFLIQVHTSWEINMTVEEKPFSPTCQPLLHDGEKPSPDADSGSKNGGVKMRKELGLLEGTSIILGIIMGSGNILFNFFFLFLYTSFLFRNFYITKGGFEGCRICRLLFSCLGAMRRAFPYRSIMLCRAWHRHPAFWLVSSLTVFLATV